MTQDDRLDAPAAARNRDPILDVLRRVLPDTGLVLEIASGTGQHVVHFARALPALDWQPSEPDAGGRRSIAAWSAADGLANVRAPLGLDVIGGKLTEVNVTSPTGIQQASRLGGENLEAKVLDWLEAKA